MKGQSTGQREHVSQRTLFVIEPRLDSFLCEVDPVIPVSALCMTPQRPPSPPLSPYFEACSPSGLHHPKLLVLRITHDSNTLTNIIIVQSRSVPIDQPLPTDVTEYECDVDKKCHYMMNGEIVRPAAIAHINGLKHPVRSMPFARGWL